MPIEPTDQACKEFRRVYNKTHISPEAQVRAALRAAFASQFKPVEEYAGLVERLRFEDQGVVQITKANPPRVTFENTVPLANLRNSAADAIEALCARLAPAPADDKALLEAAIAEGSLWVLRPGHIRRMIEYWQIIRKDGDAETIIEEIPYSRREDKQAKIWDRFIELKTKAQIDAALSIARPGIEAAERERCADSQAKEHSAEITRIRTELAAAIQERDEARDLSWFWEIVDRDGFADVPSSERDALRILVRQAKERDALREALKPFVQTAPVGCSDGDTQILTSPTGEQIKIARAALDGTKQSGGENE